MMTGTVEISSEELLLNFVKDVIDKPEIFISQNSEVASKITNVVKNLYDTAKKDEPFPLGPIPELLTEGFDYEQIWEEIQLQNQPLLEYVDAQLEDLSTMQDQAISDSENSDSADSDAQVPELSEEDDMSAEEEENASEGEEEEENEEDIESPEEKEDSSEDDNIDPERSEVDDEFFSLAQMEDFTEKAEEMELQDKSDDEDEIDYFADPDELSDSDDEGTNANDITFGEFFKDGKKRPAKADSAQDKKKVRFSENKETEKDEDEEVEPSTKDLFAQNDDEDEEGTEKLSSFEKHQRKIQETISQLENENVGAKDWTLMGEASVRTRPVNSLLEEDLEFDHASKPVPVITQEVTETLEDMIKRRILDGLFDDVERKKDPNLPAFLPSKKVALNDEKSKKSLSELYEDEYIKQTTGHVVNEKDDALKKAHDDIDELFKDLCFKLDSLSNFHFTPKMVSFRVKDLCKNFDVHFILLQPKAEITVISDAPAIAMEEVTPVNVSDANLLAPEEVYEKPSQKKNKKKKGKN
ncbi:U3 snoRNP protein [Basidiobolus ranarum]|uniref:U3 small nucleolar ribonucleoprotein protein MPP10 n=1 Tax=Basidiobolus ranarum TaxID=34480 RepID=A0ABR2WAC8_9FUNG